MITAVALAVLSAACAPGARPSKDDPAGVARWLVASSSWGVLATTSSARDGAAWSNVVSVGDNCTGVPYFYLTELDETARDLIKDPRATLTLAEAALGPAACKGKDPEDPMCSKLSLHGQVVRAADQRAGLAVLVDKHPAMQHWSKSHGFSVYQMQIADVFVLCAYGGARAVSPTDYFHSRVRAPTIMS